MVDKIEIIKFMRTWSYVNIFLPPLVSKNLQSQVILSLTSLGFLLYTDKYVDRKQHDQHSKKN